jgi:HK97 gp10 family phage protein
MIKLTLDETKFRKLLNNIENYAPKKQREVARAVALSAFAIEAEAKRLVPVRTGRLRASITPHITAARGEVGTNVEYAPDVEFGNSSRPAKPFLFPAWNQERPKFIGVLKRIFK